MCIEPLHIGMYCLNVTENEVEFVEHFSTHFKDGLIFEHHTTTDTYSILRQLGVTIPPESVKEKENKEIVRQYFTALNELDREAFEKHWRMIFHMAPSRVWMPW